MIQIDLEIPKCCDECKFVYDSCKCIITGSRIDWEKSDSERLLDCPLNKIAEPKTGHWIGIDEEPHEVWECDHCGFVIDGSGCIDPYDYRDTYKYCPYCGARMVEEQESEVKHG